MRQISEPTVRSAAVLVLVSGMTLSAGLGEALAEDCLAAPNGTSPAGQHWYYRIDRATHRHCWYLHGAQPVAHRGHHAAIAADEQIEHPAPAAPVPAAAGPWPVIMPPMPEAAAPLPAADPPMAEAVTASNNMPVEPNVPVLAVKTIAVRPPEAPAETRSRHRAHEASISEGAAHAYRATPASQPEPTMFFFLIFGLGLVTFLVAIVLKRVAPQASWSWPSQFWPARRQPDMAPDMARDLAPDLPWWQERSNYSGAAPTRPAIGSRRTDRRVMKTSLYADENGEAEYEYERA